MTHLYAIGRTAPGPDAAVSLLGGYRTDRFVLVQVQTPEAGWYLLVAWLASNPAWLPRLQARAVWIERLFGVILLALAARLVWETFS